GDLDGDGDPDMVGGERYGTLATFENEAVPFGPPSATLLTGSANPLSGQDPGARTGPALADLDGDGGADLVVGEDGGGFFYFENTGSVLTPAYVARTGAANPLGSFDVGSRAKPLLVDFEADGDLDLIAGISDGTFMVAFNTGSRTAADFS